MTPSPNKDRIVHKFIRLSLWLLTICFFRIRVFGRRNIPTTGGVLLASNHQSFLDPVLVGMGVDRETHFMARDDLFEIKPLRFIIERLNAFQVRRGVADRTAIREAVKRLKAGHPVVMFPEGTRNDSGGLGELRQGAAFVAIRSVCTVVPVAVYGAHRAWPTRFRVCHSAPITVGYGTPIETAGKKVGELAEEIENGIREVFEKIS